MKTNGMMGTSRPPSAIVGGFTILAVAGVLASPAHLAAQAEDCTRVCNDEPLRVQGNVVVDDFRREERISPRELRDAVPFQQAVTFSFPPGTHTDTASFQVPAANSLAIYQAMVEVQQNGRTPPYFVWVTFTSLGQEQTVVTQVGSLLATDPLANTPMFSVAKALQIYADPASMITVVMSGGYVSHSPGTAQAKVGFSGLLY